MSFYDNALKRLKEIYADCESDGRLNFFVSRESILKMDPDKRRSMENDFYLMESEGWIAPFKQCGERPLSFILTAEGVRVAEGRLYASVEDFAKLIRAHEPEPGTQKEILDTLKLILEKMNRKEALEPGILKKLNNYLQEASWLSSPVASLLLRYLAE